LQAIEDELENDSIDEYAYAETDQDYYEMPNGGAYENASATIGLPDYYGGGQMADAETETSQYAPGQSSQQVVTAAINGQTYPAQCDVAVQTDVTDEDLLLRLLRTAPELLDLVQVVLRR